MDGGWLSEWLFHRSVGTLVLMIFAAMSLSALAGHFIQRYHLARWDDDDQVVAATQEGFMVSGSLGLLALLLAFTFAMVLNRYEARRQLVTQESNAIGTAYLRTQLLEDPHRSRLSALLVAYTDNRINLANNQQSKPLLRMNDELATAIWAAVSASRESALAHGITTPLLLSYTEVLDLGTERNVARQLRVPVEILQLLLVCLIVTAAVVGHSIQGERGWRAALVLFILLSFSIGVITDLNRPMSGSERESQDPMIAQLQTMREHPPRVYDRFRISAPRALQAVR